MTENALTYTGSGKWEARVNDPLVIKSPSEIDWDGEYDVVVVGFGGAGVCAALEALKAGSDVAVVDRYHGGGATSICGNVFYTGGGTEQQKEAGLEDSPENMYAYLKEETQGVISDETLKRFCDNSLDDQKFLESYGVAFDGGYCPYKTSYPTHRHRLYYSGNESVPRFAKLATPVPRGHIARGLGKYQAMGVPAIYGPLKKGALEAGATPYFQADARQLIVDEAGDLIGIEIWQMPQGTAEAQEHWELSEKARDSHMINPEGAEKCRETFFALERAHARPLRLRARKGVILSAGGFSLNQEMRDHYAPKFATGMALGTTGDDGAGIMLGQSAGGAVDRMDEITAWRFINPPFAWAEGIIVNAKGARYTDESMYGSSIGTPMFVDNEGVAIIIIDKKLRRKSFRNMRPKIAQPMNIMQGLLNSFFNTTKAATLKELATKMGMDASTLRASVETYNKGARGERADPFGKDPKYIQALEKGPFYAIDVSAGRKYAPCPVLTLGGLVVDETTGQVRNGSGVGIKGLFAAGRNAVGICSNGYISGLSVADCVFSGRRAGRAVAALT